MTAELLCLVFAALLWAGQLAHAAVRANLEVGSRYFLSPRDTPPPVQPSQATARLMRAYDNHKEALLLFAVAIIALTLTGKENLLTTVCAAAYLLARILFVPAYAMGWVPWRSVFFGIGFVASVLILIVALF